MNRNILGILRAFRRLCYIIFIPAGVGWPILHFKLVDLSNTNMAGMGDFMSTWLIGLLATTILVMIAGLLYLLSTSGGNGHDW